jgi:transcriptional regulator GlxA family with amidase domain
MNIVFFIFDRLTALDAVGPYEVLARLPGARVTFAGLERGQVRTDNGCLGLHVDTFIDEIDACDVLVVPGGYGTRPLENNVIVRDWLQRVDKTTRISASVCTGALLLGAAGLLKGRRANTHFAVRHRLAEFGALPVAERVVADGKYRTAAGVSAGIDLAFSLAIELSGREVAESIQLGLEYAPEPPLDAGREDTAPAAIVAAVRERVRRRDEELRAAASRVVGS